MLPGITCTDSDRSSAIVPTVGRAKWGRENIASNDDQIRRMLFDRSQRCPEVADIPFAIGNKGDSFTGHLVRSYPAFGRHVAV